MTRRPLIAAFIAAVSICSTMSRAKADGLRVGVQAQTAVPLLVNDDIGSPSLGGGARLQWLHRDLALGVIVWYEHGSYDSTTSTSDAATATLTSTTVGLSAQEMFAPPDWDSRPFAGIEA